MRRNQEDYSPFTEKRLVWEGKKSKPLNLVFFMCIQTPTVVRIDFERYIHQSLFLSHAPIHLASSPVEKGLKV